MMRAVSLKVYIIKSKFGIKAGEASVSALLVFID